MTIKINYNDKPVFANSDAWRTQILDSWRIKSRKDMRAVLFLLRERLSPYDAINRLSVRSMMREWRAHNLLYALGIQRKRTKDVDLNNEKWWRQVCYAVLSALYPHF